METITIEYYDEICCDDAELVTENEVCDTYGGDYTYKDVYSCVKCKRAFANYFGGRFNGTDEIEYQENKYNY
jgi:hypothetical protein